jgi:hypothetical protein
MPLQEVCAEIDSYVKSIYENPIQHDNAKFRKYITYIHGAWIEGKDNAETLFPYFHHQKGSILCQIILDKKRRELLTQFADWEDEEIESILVNRDKIKILMNPRTSLESKITALE